MGKACVVTRRLIAKALPTGAAFRTQGDPRGVGIRCVRVGRGDAFAFVRHYSTSPRLVRISTAGDCPTVEVTCCPAEAPGLVQWVVEVMRLDQGDAIPADHESFDGAVAAARNFWTVAARDLYRWHRSGGWR